MTTVAVPDRAGFADPVFDAQRSFRAVLDAMARPGTVAALDGDLDPPAPLGAATAAVLLTLCDADTPLWLGGGLAAEPVRRYLAYHTGAPLAAGADRAAFAVTDDWSVLRLDSLDIGTDAYPDRSTTAVVQRARLSGGPRVALRGPGIDGARTLALPEVPNGFAAAWLARRALFPRGIDVIFTAPDEVLALPRSIDIEEN